MDATSHALELRRSLAAAREDESWIDVVLGVDDDDEFRTNAHALVLSAHSNMLKKLLSFSEDAPESAKRTILLSAMHVSADALERIVSWMYSGSVVVDASTVCDLLSAANYMQIPALERACAAFLRTAIDVHSVLQILGLALQFDLRPLASRAVEFVGAHFSQVIFGTSGASSLAITEDDDALFVEARPTRMEWNEASNEVVVRIVSSDALHISSEIDVYHALANRPEDGRALVMRYVRA